MTAPYFKSPQFMSRNDREEYARQLAREGFFEAAKYVQRMGIWE